MTEPTAQPICGSEPPSDGTWGDCWCTLPPGRGGECRCEPCTERHGAPGWAPPEAADAPKSAPQAADGPAEPRHAHDGAQAAQGGPRLLRAHVALAAQAGRDQAALARIQSLADEHPVAVPTKLLKEALDQGAHDDGPSVRECAKDDARWPLEREGE